jgi:hypothetical protein
MVNIRLLGCKAKIFRLALCPFIYGIGGQISQHQQKYGVTLPEIGFSSCLRAASEVQ